MSNQMKIAVAGGTGRVGKHVVDILSAAGHDVVTMSRSTGVDVITGDGLAEALSGVDRVVDAATGPSPDQDEATRFFTASTRNLQAAGAEAGVERMIVVSIIGCDRFTSGYNAAKVVQEWAAIAGPVPVQILRAAQFHEFVGELMDWGTQGDVSYLPPMRTQLVSARTVAEEVVRLVTAAEAPNGEIAEVGGPRTERLVEAARLLAAKRGAPGRVEELNGTDDPDAELFATDGLLPGPHATLSGPTFEEWLENGGGAR